MTAAVPAAASVLSAHNLVKRYKKRTVVRDVSVNVRAGEIVGLLGPNGAGKTTSFYMIVGLVAADGGRIELDGEDLTRAPMHARARRGIGYLPQEASVFRKLTVEENILAILETRKELDKAGRQQELERLLSELHIAHIRDGEGQSLSGGERRRVEIARALAANPRFILLDEPFAGVDPIAVGDIQHIVHHLKQRGIGVLITDHNVRETLSLCERAYILAEGAVIAEGAPATLLENETVRRVYLGEQFKL
ncbi:MAG TPA: LPS export ABC transporter ATP-binding protein [Solimonas sp.]|nr:LPS export ABC transporter ATP-binding protein [Solimonas sp.]